MARKTTDAPEPAPEYRNAYEHAAANLAELKAQAPELAKKLDELWELFEQCIPDVDK